MPKSKQSNAAKAEKPISETFATRITRDQATIAAMRYPYNVTTARDQAYEKLAIDAAKKAQSKTFTLSDVIAVSRFDEKRRIAVNPHYSGSNKATDAGAFERLIKAGAVTRDDSGKFTLTAETVKRHNLKLS